MAESVSADSGLPATAPVQDESTVHVLAAKILNDWLRNRQQLLMPLKLDLQKLGEREAALVVHAMAAAAYADGPLEEAKRERLDSALQFVNANENHRAALAEALEHPRALRETLQAVEDVQTGAIFQAASLLAIDRRKAVNRHYLRYVAARLGLSEELSRDLSRRFGSAV
jgi:uncharacterized membrane protein YebE (DUF533 family)